MEKSRNVRFDDVLGMGLFAPLEKTGFAFFGNFLGNESEGRFWVLLPKCFGAFVEGGEAILAFAPVGEEESFLLRAAFFRGESVEDQEGKLI